MPSRLKQAGGQKVDVPKHFHLEAFWRRTSTSWNPKSIKQHIPGCQTPLHFSYLPLARAKIKDSLPT